ncbi:reduced folate transporter [Petaurus breviceps papuanus]|uniref:reduced folate transporter n=1 Tax=Petaurus breviceps papuanus TaxID=3040969 RepID=UPI0036D98518
MAPTKADVEKQGSPAPDKSWKFLVSYLCFYGFMVQMRPGESFITPYLLDRNFSEQQVTNEITPVLTYSYMAVLVPIFLLTDYLRYKPVLVLQSLSYLSVWVLLIFGSDVLSMQFMEFFFGITMAARVAYSSYIFSLVSPTRYQRMASYSRSAVLLGVFTSSVLGQVCISVGGVAFLTLHHMSLGFMVFGLLLTLFLKRPRRSLFFNRPRDPVCNGASPSELDQMNPGGPGPPAAKARWRRLAGCGDSTLVRMLRELRDIARVPQLRLWSLWWVLNFAGYYLVIYYVHILWSEVDPSKVYNGGVDAASTLLGALTSFAAGFVKIPWAVWSELVIGGVTLLQAGLILLMYSTSNIWVCYVSLVLFRATHQFLVPIATFQIASSLTKELCALVFGVNTFLATILKTIVTAVVADKRGLGLPVSTQFRVYFGYFTVLAVAYFSGAVYTAVRHCWQSRLQDAPLANELRSPVEMSEKTQSPEEDGIPGARA